MLLKKLNKEVSKNLAVISSSWRNLLTCIIIK